MHVHVWEEADWAESFSHSLKGVATVTFGPNISEDTNLLVKGTPTATEIDHLPHLKGVIIPFAGIPVSTRELLSRYPSQSVYNLHHNAADTAEMALALYFAVTKRIVSRDANMRQGKWSEGSFLRGGVADSIRSDGKSAVILGYGAIGQRIANVCRALGMTVSAIKRSGPFDSELHPIDHLHQLLPRAEALFVALPLTPETESLLGAPELGKLPANAVISNIGRAKIFDQAALFETLQEGRIAGAGIDVWWNYPKSDEPCFPSDFPFHELPNVVLSPHVGGSSDASEAHRVQALVELVRGISSGTAQPASASAGY